jgi:hypothetical protein
MRRTRCRALITQKPVPVYAKDCALCSMQPSCNRRANRYSNVHYTLLYRYSTYMPNGRAKQRKH